MKKLVHLYFTGLIIVLFSCSDDKSQAETDDAIILKYIAENNLEMTRSSSGIYYKIHKPGYGGSPGLNSTVKVKYKGYLTDGTVFDENKTGIEFSLYNLIDGWKIAISMLQKTGNGTFIIPSELGYRSKATGSIPANSVLIFEITLVDFN